MNSPRGRLVLRAPNWVGDLVMATPVIEAAMAQGGWSDVRVVVREHLAPLLADAPWWDRVEAVGSSAEELARYRELLLSNSFGAAWRAWRAGARWRAGTALSGRRLFLTHHCTPPTRAGRRVPVPTAHLLRDVAGLFGIEVPSLHPRLHVRPALEATAKAELVAAGLGTEEPFVLCCPGAAFGAAKLWRPERFAEVLDRLHERHGWRGVVTGGPGEEDLMRAVASAATHRCLHLADGPRGLEGLKALVRSARLLLVGDSGPRWVAAAFDVPCVSVMGPNFPELTATSLEHALVVRQAGLACSPCLQRTCPLGHHRCMEDLGVESVVEAAEEVLARAPEPAPV